MWALENRTSYAAERTWVRDKTGVHHWVIAVKATFALGASGSVRLADEQRPPLLEPEYTGEPGASSLRYEADLGPMKPTTDVLVLASAYAPGGRPAETVPVCLRVDTLEKALLVHGERVYFRGLTGVEAYRPEPFVRRPIVYEVAYGGTDTRDADPQRHGLDRRNPVGRGFAMRSDTRVGTPAPSVEYPGLDAAKAGPAGFGPLASYWSPRLERGGTYDARWEQTKKPLLPDDYDERFVLCAPADQQSARHLYGGERVELVNMTPDGYLRLDLPRLYFHFTTAVAGRREEHRSRLVTVLVEPDDARLTLVWQTSLRVAAKDVEHLEGTLVTEKPYLR